MTRDLRRLTSERFDLLVVGGGIHGLLAAYDAAQRGLATALVERGDFAAATSFNHLKTVHGGLRSLQSGNLRRARALGGERRTFARIAPHLVEPLAFVMPLYRSLTRGRLAVSAAFLTEAALGYDRNHGVPASHLLPMGRVVRREECLRLFPHPPRVDEVKGGALWHDYQMHHADRLSLAFAIEADAHGAALANYVEMAGFLREGAAIAGIHARDRASGAEVEIRARVTLNAAGPWAPALARQAGVAHELTLFKNLNLVTSRPGKSVAWVAQGREGRALVAMPWRGRLIIGTLQADRPSTEADTAVSEAEVERALAQVNEAFPALRLLREEVTLVHRGMVPAVERDGRLELRQSPELRDHAGDGAPGLVSLVGVKYTMARLAAERAVDVVVRRLAKRTAPCRTATTPLSGGAIDDIDPIVMDVAREPGLSQTTARHLVSAYGHAVDQMVRDLHREPALAERVIPTRPVIRAEVVRAVRDEMALTLADAVIRRTTLGAARHPGPEALKVCAGLMAAELGWDAARIEREKAEVDAFYRVTQ